ncbi:MAG: type II toxin-antitoxin system PemK/MazF family toxin [Sinobacteraceae bacterium]|jgi:mRNA interferase MazF|nr:type II toxin-antitoxin system PemK/MazF family toxin [Nevskia sp.]MDI3259300.1 type II toxin-antitoxin system PemK/MazF family toxin [Nevskiaceae bacterium]
MRAHLPDRGQIVVLDFDPQAGAEIGKRRPALVMSPKSYNRVTGLVLVCPITTQPRDYPFEVRIQTAKTVGAALADRLHSFDWRARRCALIEKAPSGFWEEVRAKFLTLIEDD